MTPNQLPPMPDGVTLEDLLIPLRAALDTCHDTDWSLRQFKTHISHALAALAQQAQEPVAASAKDVASRALGEAAPLLYRAGHHEESGRCNAALLILEGLAVATPQPKPAPTVPVCPRCDGAGTVTEMSDNSPDAHEVDIACPHCNGSGALEDAYTGAVALLKRATENYHRALPYMVKVKKEAAGLPPPAVPAPVDEREAFEAWMDDDGQGPAPRICSRGSPCEGEYADQCWETAWRVWQAGRATQPAPVVPAPVDERAEFERAAHQEGCTDFRRVGEAYSDRRTLRCYRIWQKARAALQSPAPQATKGQP